MRIRRWCRAWLESCCSSVRSSLCGFLLGMRISTCGSVKARTPTSGHNELPLAKGDMKAGLLGAVDKHFMLTLLVIEKGAETFDTLKEHKTVQGLATG